MSRLSFRTFHEITQLIQNAGMTRNPPFLPVRSAKLAKHTFESSPSVKSLPTHARGRVEGVGGGGTSPRSERGNIY